MSRDSLTLAKIFMMRGRDKSEWNGTEPEYSDRLFVYAHIGNTTYNSYMPRKTGSIYDSDFTSMRADSNGPAGVSYLHNKSGSIILPLMQGAHNDIGPLQSNCRIYHDKENKIWYKLNKECYQCDTEVSTNGFTSRHDILKIPNNSIKPSYESKMGDPCSIGSDYTPLTEYVTGNQLYILKREIRQTSTSGRSRTPRRTRRTRSPPRETLTQVRPRSRSPIKGGGGKTRRKFKVKKRRNRRIRNTMKRRKTAVKRRNR
jgi:hypothetical protein